MYIRYICFLAPFIQIGFSLIREGTDLNSLSSYDAIDDNHENFEIWNSETDAGIVVFDSFSRAEIEAICKDSNTLVYISQEDVTIDCRAFNNGDKPIDAEKNRVKRAVEGEFEGSGSEDITDGNNEDSHTENTNAEDSKLVEPSLEDNNNEDSLTMQTILPTEIGKDEGSENNTNQENPIAAVPQEENTQITELPTVPQAAQDSSTNASPPTEESVGKNNETDRTLPITTTVKSETESDNEEIVTDFPYNINRNEETPQGQADTEKNDPNLTSTQQEEVPPLINAPKEADEVDSGDKDDGKPMKTKGRGLVLPPSGQESEKQEHDKNSRSDETVKTDESTDSTIKKSGSKDTTILVVLFVAVVVVGALAFGYNFIKKRKQQSADLERVERGSIKRSLQNLTKPDNEPEKKPLMGEGKEVEMVDMRKSNSSLEATAERTPNESSIKT